jgi:hypothetical protein
MLYPFSMTSCDRDFLVLAKLKSNSKESRQEMTAIIRKRFREKQSIAKYVADSISAASG